MPRQGTRGAGSLLSSSEVGPVRPPASHGPLPTPQTSSLCQEKHPSLTGQGHGQEWENELHFRNVLSRCRVTHKPSSQGLSARPLRPSRGNSGSPSFWAASIRAQKPPRGARLGASCVWLSGPAPPRSLPAPALILFLRLCRIPADGKRFSSGLPSAPPSPSRASTPSTPGPHPQTGA